VNTNFLKSFGLGQGMEPKLIDVVSHTLILPKAIHLRRLVYISISLSCCIFFRVVQPVAGYPSYATAYIELTLATCDIEKVTGWSTVKS